MKKLKYLVFAMAVMAFGVGSVFASSITFPSVVEVNVGETKEIDLTLDDLVITLDIINSDATVATADESVIAGSNQAKNVITVSGLKEGETTLTITSDDATSFSTEQPYTLTPRTITIRVLNNSVNPDTDPVPGNDTPASKPTKDDTVDEPTKNPKTGIEDYILPVIGVNILLFGSYFFIKKFSVFKSF